MGLGPRLSRGPGEEVRSGRQETHREEVHGEEAPGGKRQSSAQAKARQARGTGKGSRSGNRQQATGNRQANSIAHRKPLPHWLLVHIAAMHVAQSRLAGKSGGHKIPAAAFMLYRATGNIPPCCNNQSRRTTHNGHSKSDTRFLQPNTKLILLRPLPPKDSWAQGHKTSTSAYFSTCSSP